MGLVRSKSVDGWRSYCRYGFQPLLRRIEPLLEVRHRLLPPTSNLDHGSSNCFRGKVGGPWNMSSVGGRLPFQHFSVNIQSSTVSCAESGENALGIILGEPLLQSRLGLMERVHEPTTATNISAEQRVCVCQLMSQDNDRQIFHVTRIG